MESFTEKIFLFFKTYIMEILHQSFLITMMLT